MTKKILYIDLDNTLVNFQSGIDRLPNWMKSEYGPKEGAKAHYDDAPGIFSLMEPVDGAVEAFTTLSAQFDTYLLSTSPWDNPSAWSDKLLWVKQHLGGEEGSPAYKRLILSHHKNLNHGDFLVDDRDAHGAPDFNGEWIQFGKGEHMDWPTIIDYLLARA